MENDFKHSLRWLLLIVFFLSCNQRKTQSKLPVLAKDSIYKTTENIIYNTSGNLHLDDAEDFIAKLVSSIPHDKIGKDKMISKYDSVVLSNSSDTLNVLTLYHFQSQYFRFTNVQNRVCSELEHERDYIIVEGKKYFLNDLIKKANYAYGKDYSICWCIDVYHNYEFAFEGKYYLASFIVGFSNTSNPCSAIMLFEKTLEGITEYPIDHQMSSSPIIFSDFNNDKILDFAFFSDDTDTVRTYSLKNGKKKLLPYQIALVQMDGIYLRYIDTLRSNWNFKK